MDRSESMEIKKIFAKYKEGECAAGNIAGCVVTSDKRIIACSSEKLIKNESKTITKYYSLFKKIISATNPDITFAEKDKSKDGIQYLLDKLNGTGLQNKELNKILFEKIAKTLPEEPFAIIALQYNYDVPIKDKNKEKLKSDSGDGIYGAESEEVYKFIICVICSIKTGSEHLGYDEEKIRIMAAEKSIEQPLYGFLYPAFNGRSSDEDHLTCYSSNKMDITMSLFGREIKRENIVKIKTDEERKEEIKKINEKSQKNLKKENLPLKTDKNIGEFIFVDEEQEYVVEDEPEAKKLPVSKFPKEETERKRKINIYGDRSKITKKTIDGKEYYMVLVSEAVIN